MPPSAFSAASSGDDTSILPKNSPSPSSPTTSSIPSKRARFTYLRGLNIFGHHGKTIMMEDPALVEDDSYSSEEHQQSSRTKSSSSRSPCVRKTQKNVTFSPDVNVIPGDERSEDEIRSCWRSKEELKMCRAEAVDALQKFASMIGTTRLSHDKSAMFDHDNLTSIGLEQNMVYSIHNTKRLRHESHLAVLDEQRFQADEGKSDALTLASVYSDFTNGSRTLALMRAHDVELEVSSICTD